MGLRQCLRAKHHTGSFLHWSHYPEQVWEDEALVVKPSLPVILDFQFMWAKVLKATVEMKTRNSVT